ncbi:CK5P2 protein, partial [Corythaeola cristata]|nr:CK5P2 protein [Corythaeola cristata]
ILWSFSKAVESLAQGGDAEIQRVKEEAQKKMQEMEEVLTGRINLLEENLKAAQDDLEKNVAMTEKEKALRIAAEQKLSSIMNASAKDVDMITGAEKDRLIEQLNLSLKSKEAIIQHLEEEKSQSRSYDENLPAEKIRELTIAFRHEKDREIEAIRMELKNERNSFEKKIQSLQEELQEREDELAVEKKNGLKRDKTIQGLTVALKAKEKENEELGSEIEELNASLAKAREATHKAHIQKFKGAEDYQALLMEKETLLAELRSENLTKDAENRKLQRRIKRTDQELNDLNLEREKMEKELDEAQLQKSRSDKTINVIITFSLFHTRLQVNNFLFFAQVKQQLVETQLRVQKADSTRVYLTCSSFICWLDAVLFVQKWNRNYRIPPPQKANFIQNTRRIVRMILDCRLLYENKEAEYEKLILALRKEQNIYSTLVKTFKESDSINSLQTELNNIFMLRKQLEEDVLANRNLQKVLEDQIKDIKNRQDETLSFCGDQTSYMSICLGEQDHLSLQIDHLSLEELKKKVTDLLLMVKDLQSINQELKRKQLGLCTTDSQGNEALKILNHSECLEITEEPVMQTEDGDNDRKMQNSQFSEKVSQSFCKDRYCRSPNKPQFEHDTTGKHFGRIGMSEHETEENLLTSLLRENRTSVLESTQEQMKIVNELLDHLNTTEQECSSEDIEKKDEKDLRQMIIQLRAELKHFKQVNKFIKQQVELQSTFDGKEKLYPDAMPQINKDIELLKVELKDAATQTMTLESNVMRFKHEGRKEASEEKPKYSRLNAEREHQQENLPTSHFLSCLFQTGSAYLHKKSRLPVLLKSSRPLGNVPLNSCMQKSDAKLRCRTRVPYEGLKACEVQNKQFQPQTNGELLLNEDNGEVQVELHGVDPGTGGKNEYAMDKNQQNYQGAAFININIHMQASCFSEMQNHRNISNVNIQCSLKEINEEFLSMEHEDIDSATAYSGSKCLHSLKLSVTSTDALDNCEVIDDIEELKQRIKNMKCELEQYKMFVFKLQTSNQLLSSDISNTVLTDTALPMEGHVTQVQDTAMQEIKTFSNVRQLMDYDIHTENRNAESSKAPDTWTAQNLKELLSVNEAELEKEQIANMHLDEVYHLQNKLRETSLSTYDSLVHSQARELSFQHQQIREIGCGCVTYHQHLMSLIKAFEELLQASDVDYYVAEGFREQLNQSVLLFEKLERKFLYGKDNEKNTTMYQQLKDESPVPSALHSLSDFDLSEKSSLGSPEHRHDLEGQHGTLALLPNKFPPELLMEHLQEIRILRQRLEYSIKTNERLRKQLERQVTDKELDQGSANIFIHGSEQHNSLTSEIHFLRKQNQVLNAMLAKGSRDKQKENEKLRESLSKKNAIIEHLHEDYERIKKENERLQKQIGQKEDETRYLTCQIYSSRNELNRLQTEINVKQRQLSENEKLLQSLRTEIKVYEKLGEARKKRTDPRCDASEEFRKDQNNPLDLQELLTEIQSLRVQLERSIETNKSLHEKLEEQLSKEKREEVGSVSAVNINYLFKQGSQHYAGMNGTMPYMLLLYCRTCALFFKDALKALYSINCTHSASKDDLDSASHCSSTSSSSTACTPRLVPGHRMWADKNGRHVLGLIEDYNALRKQISEGQQVVAEMEISLREVTGTKLQESGIKVNSESYSLKYHIFSNDLVKILIMTEKVISKFLTCFVGVKIKADEGMKAEIFRLRKKLSEQEKKLHSTVKRLHSTNQLKENMEKVIIDQ